jgi:hypothetical protein
LFFYTGYLQGYALDMNVVFVSEGGENKLFEKCLSTCENIDDGYLHQTWVVV